MSNRPPLHWSYPAQIPANLYRAGWRADRTFQRIVAEIGGRSYVPVSTEEVGFTIHANTLNKVRDRDVLQLVIPGSLGMKDIGLDTQLDGIRVSGPKTRVGGISLFDDYRTAPISSKNWYLIPPEVTIPKALTLVKATTPSAAGATHFTLGPAEPMSLAQFIRILTPFANDERIKPVGLSTTTTRA